MNCLILGCVKNCEKYLDDVFQNIDILNKYFNNIKVYLFYDNSEDDTLKKLKNIKINKEYYINIYENKKYVSGIRTVRLAYARNFLLRKVYKSENKDYEYFIIMDMDDVMSKKINIKTIKFAFKNLDKWDSISFLDQNYYDIWALRIDNFLISCWNFNKGRKVINYIREYIKNKKELYIVCNSAFNGFAIYKKDKFKNCFYTSKKDFSKLSQKEEQSIKYIENICDVKLKETLHYDCEHYFFHENAILKNNAKIIILNKSLFD